MSEWRSKPIPPLRPVDMFPVETDEGCFICLRDSKNLATTTPLISEPAVFALSLCNGNRTSQQVASIFSERTGHSLPLDSFEELITELDQLHLLASDRFRTHEQAQHRLFQQSLTREPAHAGGSYPKEPNKLKNFLDELIASQTHPQKTKPLPKAIITPHIDYMRGSKQYGSAYATLIDAGETPDLVVIFGTDHHGQNPFTLTRKSYETPLGVVPTDVDLVDHLTKALANECDLLADEFHHKTEHSIEFQVLWIRHIYGEQSPLILPVLCGSLFACIHHGFSPRANPVTEKFISELLSATRNRRTLFIAGADLAHVGPQFGDPEPFLTAEKQKVQEADEVAMQFAVQGNADDFFQAIASRRDEYRICGLAPIYATLRMTEHDSTRGEVIDYAQCPADEKHHSWVTIASAALYLK